MEHSQNTSRLFRERSARKTSAATQWESEEILLPITALKLNQKFRFSSETETLKEGTVYTVSYKNNIEVGTATAVVKGKEIITGTLTITFKIVKKSQDDGNKDKISVGKCDFIVMDDEETYDGTAHKPDVIVAWLENKLIEGTDYTLSYSNNVNAGTAKVTITGIGKYTGSVTTSFEIKPASPEIQAKNKTVDMVAENKYHGECPDRCEDNLHL